MSSTANSIIEPLASLRVSRYFIPRHDRIPDCSIQHKPLLIYHRIFQPSASATQIEAYLQGIRVGEPQWRYTMYNISHFRSTTHEFPCITAGRARLCFGGEENSEKVVAE